MDLLWVLVRLQKPAQQRPGSRSRGSPLARLGVDPRDKLLESLVSGPYFAQSQRDFPEKPLGGATAVVLDIRDVSGRDLEVARESAERESGL